MRGKVPVEQATLQRDTGLVDAALRDSAAFAAIVGQFKQALGRYLRRVLGSHAQSAEDVLQDAFINAYLNLNDYDRSRPLSPWLYRIAHNEAVSYLRKRNVEPQTLGSEDAILILERQGGGDDPGLAWLRNGTVIEVHQALSTLEVRYRDVLTLRYLEDKSYDEISDILELPPGTVATLLSRGLKRLRAPLEPTWGTT